MPFCVLIVRLPLCQNTLLSAADYIFYSTGQLGTTQQAGCKNVKQLIDFCTTSLAHTWIEIRFVPAEPAEFQAIYGRLKICTSVHSLGSQFCQELGSLFYKFYLSFFQNVPGGSANERRVKVCGHAKYS